MDERVIGFRVRGSWDDVVGHGERIARVLQESDVDEDALAEWEDWRPKAHEDLGEEVSKRTVEKASIGEGAGEQAEQVVREDLELAGEQALESIEKARADGPEDMLEIGGEAVDRALRAVDTTTRRAIRTVETTICEEVTTRFALNYFGNELVSANILETTRLENGDEFVFEVDVNDDQLKQEVSQRLDTAEEAERGKS